MELWVDNGWTGNGPWRGALDGLLRESGPSDHIVPAADVTEDPNGYHFYFEIPGMANESIDVRVEDESLVVEAERKRPEWAKDTEIHRTERFYGRIHRRFRAPGAPPPRRRPRGVSRGDSRGHSRQASGDQADPREGRARELDARAPWLYAEQENSSLSLPSVMRQ